MAKFEKINAVLDAAHARLDQLDAAGVDITKLSTKPAGDWLARDTKRFEARQAKAAANNAWAVGALVITPRDETGVIVAIDGHNVVLEIAGGERKFSAKMLRAA